MNFEKFLSDNLKSTNELFGFDKTKEWINQKALGEWAWSFILADIKQLDIPNQAKKEGWVFDFHNVDAYYAQEMEFNQIALHWEIAVVCLGKKEIIKRLKEIQNE